MIRNHIIVKRGTIMITLTEIQLNLSKAIKNSGMTQSQLAKQLGVSQSCIAHYVKGDIMPALDTFANLCKLLDESSDFILGLEENK